MEQSSRAVEGPLDATVVPPAPKRATFACTTGLADPLQPNAEDQRFTAVECADDDPLSLNCPKGDEPCIRGCKGWECRDGWPDAPGLMNNLNDEAPSNAAHWHKVAMECRAEIDRLHVENARLAKEAKRLQGLLDAVHQIAGELARPSGI